MFIVLFLIFLVTTVILFFKYRETLTHLRESEEHETELKRLISRVDELSVQYNETEMENERLVKSVELYESVLQAASRLIEMASQFDSDKSFLCKLLDEAVELIPEADYGSVAIVDNQNWEYVHTVGHNKEKLASLPLKKEHFIDPRNSTDTMYFDSNVFVIDNVEKQNPNMPEELFDKFLNATKRTKQTAIMEIDIGNDVAGTISLDISRGSEKTFSNESLKMFGALGNIASTFIAFQRLNKIQEEFQKEIVLSIIRMMEIHDEYTRGHSEMVANLSMRIAEKMGYEKEEAKEVYWAGLVHDIGKILVPASILNKPAKLSNDEYAIIKKHPSWGYEVLSQSRFLEKIAKVVRHHHERTDGSGYPDGIVGNDIPEISRILSVADTWDAMTRDRAYRKALDRETALYELEKNKDKQFDKRVVDAFMELSN